MEKTKPELFLTVDLEDSQRILRAEFGLTSKRCERVLRAGVDRIREVLGTVSPSRKVTFFTSGSLPAAYPEVVRDITEDGHEIACHGLEHERPDSMGRKQFVETVSQAKNLLEQFTSQKVLGYRAPSFGVGAASPWFLDALVEVGFRFDSSLLVTGIMPKDHVLLPRVTSSGVIHEFPLSLLRPMPGVKIRAIGGTYFRLLPLCLIQKILSTVRERGFVPQVWLHASDFVSDFRPVSFAELRKKSLTQALMWPYRRAEWGAGADTSSAKLLALANSWQFRGALGEYLT